MKIPRALSTMLLAGITAIAALSGTSHAAEPGKEIRIGYQKGGTLALLRADGKLDARLAKEGAAVKWIEFPAGPQLLEALNTGSIDFGKLKASNDPAKGLLLSFPVTVHTEDDTQRKEIVKVRINRADSTNPVFSIEK